MLVQKVYKFSLIHSILNNLNSCKLNSKGKLSGSSKITNLKNLENSAKAIGARK